METQHAGQGWLKDLENFFETYLHKKAPFHLPANAKKVIVDVGPWIALILIVLAIPVILAAWGLSGRFAPAAMYYGYHFGWGFQLSTLLGLACLVMEAAAIPGLFKKSLKAWYLVYYASLVSALSQLFAGSIIGMLIGLIISLYVLFEIKEYYK